ncbi:chromate efflux transporter [Stappia stellulata]|uniref:chromate efflux transporter n=1 Tax=Stappia stellulata TaxID=71235 RepID=UPI001CD794B0|nr:chromate efflux transporter [Stappia stellulata]MCA1243628.1 chromate efflux transporter [Stappia stellulata]
MTEPPHPPDPAPASAPDAAEFAWLARRSFSIGLLSFGGPAAQIALLHKEFVADGKRISEGRFLNALNYCMLLPGPEAQQLATYCGWIVAGTRGGIVSGLLFIAPGALAMLALSLVYVTFGASPLVAGLFFGIKAGVLAIVLQALVRLSARAMTSAAALAIAAASFCALFLFDLPFPLVIVAAGLCGLLVPRAAATPSPAQDESRARPAADRSLHARALRILATGIALWALPVAAIVILLSPGHVFANIAAFFSTMALVSFGGAYALLSYMAQVAVETNGWLTAGEMLDGLGLAETTPGPLILVTQFVGYLGGYRAPAPFDPAVAGLLAAGLTTWVTFAPSFVFVLAGAPYVDRIRGVAWLSNVLSAITAAVVGTILNLSVWFAINVLFATVTVLDAGWTSLPLPVAGSLQPWSLAIAAGAGVMLFALKRSVAEVVIAASLAGLALRMSGLAS